MSVSVDEACERVVAIGRGTCLAKFDVEGVFQTVASTPRLYVVAGHTVERLCLCGQGPAFWAEVIYNAIADAQILTLTEWRRSITWMISWFLGHHAPVSASRH